MPEEVAAFLESGGFRIPGMPEETAVLHRSPETGPRRAASAREGKPALRSSECHRVQGPARYLHADFLGRGITRGHNRRMTARELAADICRTLQSSGFKAYLVGGCVRDLVLGREPEDYDVATDAHPARVQELFPSSVDVGARFGVILVAGDGAQVEVATFRSDVGYSDGRHPDRVEYSSLPEEDVRRRDFTINGLMLDVETRQILDFVGGQEDLRQGIVRAIGAPELRFREDGLRMVWAVRFAEIGRAHV